MTSNIFHQKTETSEYKVNQQYPPYNEKFMGSISPIETLNQYNGREVRRFEPMGVRQNSSQKVKITFLGK